MFVLKTSQMRRIRRGDGVAYFDDDSDSEVEPYLSSGEYDGAESSHEDEDSTDEDNEEVWKIANTNRK